MLCFYTPVIDGLQFSIQFLSYFNVFIIIEKLIMPSANSNVEKKFKGF